MDKLRKHTVIWGDMQMSADCGQKRGGLMPVREVPGVILEAQRIRREAAALGHDYLCHDGGYSCYSSTWEECRNSDHHRGVNNVHVALRFAWWTQECRFAGWT